MHRRARWKADDQLSGSRCETYVMIEENVRGRDVFLIQPTCPPTNEHLMEPSLPRSTPLCRASAGPGSRR